MRLADQRAANARAVERRLDRQRRQRDSRELLATLDHVKPREQDVADDLAFFFRHKFDDRVAVGDQRIDQAGLGLLPERMFFDEADRLAVAGRRRPDRHHAHDNLFPFSSFVPRRNSCALTGFPPAR